MEKRQSKRNAYFSSTKFTSPISSLRTFLAVLVLIVAFAFSGGNLHADPVVVPILNPSFEEPALTAEANWADNLQDWGLLGGGGTTIARPGIIAPETASDGTQIAYTAVNDFHIFQEVGTMDANTTYTFSVDVAPLADPATISASVVIEDSETWTAAMDEKVFRPSWEVEREDFSLTLGQWTTVTITFNSLDFQSINGNTQRIRMSGSQLAWDNARLTKEVNPTLTFTTQPMPLFVDNDGGATLSVTTESTAGDVTYQWRKNGVDIDGATSDSLTIDPVAATNAGDYTVVATNNNSSITSDVATLTVVEYVSLTNASFEEPDLAVNGFHTGQDGWTNLEGGTSPGGTIHAVAREGLPSIGTVSATDGEQIVWNPGPGNHIIQEIGEIEPNSVYTMLVDIRPIDINNANSQIFIESPGDPWIGVLSAGYRPNDETPIEDYTLAQGEWTTAVASFNSANFDGTEHEGWTEPDASGRSFRIRLFGDDLVYDNVRLFRTYAPSITTQPTDLAVTEGQSTDITVAVDALPAPTFQWQKDGVDIPGANGAALNIPTTAFADAGSYTVVITNSNGTVTSDPAVLTVNAATAAPTISVHPASQVAGIGESVTLSVSATGLPAPTYQWKKGETNIDGATNATLTIDTIADWHTGDYSVVVTNSEGSATSDAATLTVGQNVALLNPSFELPAKTAEDSWHNAVDDWGTIGGIGTTFVPDNFAQYPAPDGNQIAWAQTDEFNLFQGIGIMEPNTVYAFSIDLTPLADLASTSANVIIEESDDFSAILTTTEYHPADDAEREDFTLSAGNWTTVTVSFDSADFQSINGKNMRIRVSGANIAIDNARLVKTSAPAITTHPVATAVIEGSQAVLSVVATGAPAPTYQWKKGADDIDGATSSSLTIDTVAIDDSGDYSVVITNFLGSVTSDAAALTVTPLEAPAITEQPMDLTVVAPAAASFSVVATGVPAPSYQWQKGGIDIEGANNATLTINPTDSVNAGEYSVVVTNSQGSVSSNAATLTVNLEPDSAPVVTTHPLSQTVTAPASVTFSVESTGFPVPTYQWKKDGVDIPGANSVTYTIDPTSVEDAGDYSVTLTNSEGSDTSNAATLTVNPPLVAPEITLDPQSQTVPATSMVVFTAAASGNPEPTYQWQKNGVDIDGETGSSLTIDAVDVSNAGDFTVIATNSEGEATSAVATLTVTQPTAFDSWAISYGLSGADLDMMADPDNDGDNNLFEYATGGHPAGGADPIASRPSVKFVKVNGVEELQYSYPQRLNAPELSYQVETANSLDDSWSVTGYEAMTPNTAINDDFELVTVRVLVGTDPEFVRLVINYTAP